MSMFMEEPHSMHRYYGELLRANRSKVFQNNHQLIAYYASAKALNCIEKALNNRIIDMKWRHYRYHILLIVQTLIRKINNIKSVPQPNSKDMENLCKMILKIINNSKDFKTVLIRSVNLIEKTLEGREHIGQRIGPERTKDFTTALLSNIDSIILDVKKDITRIF